MLDLYDELTSIVAEFEQNNIPYALCGGLAMAVYGVQRNTVDIALLIRPEHLKAVKTSGKKLGYVFEAFPMSFAGGNMEIRRISKIDKTSGDALMLDLLLATRASEDVWQKPRATGVGAWKDLGGFTPRTNKAKKLSLQPTRPGRYFQFEGT